MPAWDIAYRACTICLVEPACPHGCRTGDKCWSLLDVVVEALELDCPRHVDELLRLEKLLTVAKEVDLRLLPAAIQARGS